MLICRDAKLEDIIKIYEKEEIDPEMNLKIPTLFYIFVKEKEDREEKLGFAQIEVKDDIFLKEFSIKSKDPEVKLFFLKALGYKISNLGKEFFYDPKNFRDGFYESKDKIFLKDLFIGTCGDHVSK